MAGDTHLGNIIFRSVFCPFGDPFGGMFATQIAKAKLVAALSNNLNEDNEGKDFERRARIAELMLKEKDINIKEKDISSNENIARMQMNKSGAETAIKIDEHNMKKEEHSMKKEELALKKAGKKPVKITAPSGETYTAE